MSNIKPVLGIDLGTTNSCIAIWRNGGIEIIPNKIGQRTTPSIVSFIENQVYVGEVAKCLLTENPKNTIYDIKRLIGRKFDEKVVQHDIKLFPFSVKKDSLNNSPKIIVEYKNKEQSFYPEQISAMILNQLKQDAEEYLGEEIKDAIITVPAYFNDRQRQATKNAGIIAGFNILRVINEPTSAAIAYRLETKIKGENKNQKFLVFDLGGGTLDASLLSLSYEEEILEVIGTKGDTHLGGEDFDYQIVNYCIEQFKKIHNIDINSNCKEQYRRLKEAAEKAKITLSNSLKTKIEIDALFNGKGLYIELTRAKFEDLCKEYFERCIKIVKDLLRETHTKKNEIKEIILVGGSTKIPKICSLLEDFFNGIKPNNNINPDEAVAYGAAVKGRKLLHKNDDDNNDEVLKFFTLLDVCPLSLGIEVVGNHMSVVIPKNTFIPCEAKQLYETSENNQEEVCFKIYEGEYNCTDNDNLLGKFNISNIPKKKKGIVKFEVTFKLDDNSILQVSAVETSLGKINQITISNDRGNLSDEDVNKFKKEVIACKNKSNLLEFLKNKSDNLEKNIKNIFWQNIKNINCNIDINKTLIDKLQLFLRRLYSFYKCFLMISRKNQTKDEFKITKNEIINKIKQFNLSMKDYQINCIPSLIEIFKDYDIKVFTHLVIDLMKLYFNKGLYLYNEEEKNINNKFVLYDGENFNKPKYYFEESINIGKINKVENQIVHQIVENDDIIEYKNIIESCNYYIKKISAKFYMKQGEDLFNKVYVNENINMNNIFSSLDNFRFALKKLRENKGNIDVETEAICLSYIAKILYRILKTDTENIYLTASQSVNLAMSLNKNVENEKWYKEAVDIVQEIRDKKLKREEKSEHEIMKEMEKSKPEIFERIEKESKTKDTIQFIKFILKYYPYKGYETINDIEKEFKINPRIFIINLLAKYHPDGYSKNTHEEKERFAIAYKIYTKLNNIISLFSKAF